MFSIVKINFEKILVNLGLKRSVRTAIKIEGSSNVEIDGLYTRGFDTTIDAKKSDNIKAKNIDAE